MKFLVDNQLPAALARFLSSKGLKCKHVADVNLDSASDKQIWQYANQHGYILISKDEDFFYMASQEKSKGKLIWIRLGNCRKRALLSSMDRALPKILKRLQSKEKIIEIF